MKQTSKTDKDRQTRITVYLTNRPAKVFFLNTPKFILKNIN